MFDIEVVDIVENSLDLIGGGCGVLVRNWTRSRLWGFDFGHRQGWSGVLDVAPVCRIVVDVKANRSGASQ